MMKMIDDEMGYFFGISRGSFGEILGDQRRTNVNSCRTSSIPLTEFWQPANLGVVNGILSRYLPALNLEVALKFFEFPTDAIYGGQKIGRPSMTDLMIMDDAWQIAVEGKMTEYVRFSDQTVAEWLSERSQGVDVMLRHRVLKTWVRYIHNARCSDLADIGEFFKDCLDVSYQFLHRAASACHKANGPEGRTPVLVYQLFFNKADSAHIAAMEAFKVNLRTWATALKLKNMKFLIFTVPVTNYADVERRFGGQRGEIFDAMREEAIYEFDFDGIEIDIYD